ncbi:putative phage major head protein [Salmonella enterica subsp. enterica serovar Paratyphi B str. SARA62]|uniref:DUF5309 domain-containing protein n=3 Tax=Salmonella enterica TaxID=28901 RepID=A0A754D9H5_SALER|nr:DUF5309 family protein [Salmonella enterica]ECK9402652.1 hypothetical protein [Salmonella enterica subsp. enterica serovar Paratyphi C str. CFSAN000603]QUZ47292.1 DUF5309 family protein [Salmonella enterica subsp. enterica serovar Paratyphi B str. CFSAN000549]HAB6611355.1 hypothetical protein [Salmonella enterica subsp. enterica serovar Paratyphi C]HAE8364214.1 hypothetical protein [Salmonella enterica subsp. enterica serovar Paratyphi B]ESE71691.1 putative phage major head protein [Salmone
MAQLYSYEHIGVKDDVTNRIYNLGVQDVQRLPFSNSIGKSKASNQKHEWQIDFDEKPGENAYPEDYEYSDVVDSYTPTIPMYNYCQKLIVGVRVTTEAQLQTYWAGEDDDQFSYQAKKKARKLLRDWEWACLNNGGYVAPSTDQDTGKPTAAKMAGVQALISSTDNGVTVSADPLSGAITYATSASTTPTEDDILDMMEQLWTANATAEIMMVSPSMKETISGMQEKDPTRVRVFENDDSISFEVSSIKDAMGNIVKVVYHNMMPANCVFFYSSKNWREAVWQAPLSEPVPKSGGARKAIISKIATLQHDNPWCSGWIQGKPADPVQSTKKAA